MIDPMPPLVFIHGAGLSSPSWKHQTAFFDDSIAIDLPGHGANSAPLLEGVTEYAGWVGNTIRNMGPAPVTLVGHSMGSLIALEAAARNSDMVSGLVLIATSAEMRVNPDLLEASAKRDADAAAMMIKWSLPRSGGYARPKDWVLEMSAAFLDSTESGVLGADFAVCDAYGDAVTTAEKVRCPTLFLLGEKDIMSRPAAAQPLAAATPDARIVVISDPA